MRTLRPWHANIGKRMVKTPKVLLCDSGLAAHLMLERRSGALVGIEVKSAATVTGTDFKGLRALAQAAGRRFHRGVVLYTGTEVVPFGPRLHAVPIEALWRWGARPAAAPSGVRRRGVTRRSRRRS